MLNLASEAATLAEAHRQVMNLVASADEGLNQVEAATQDATEASYKAVKELGAAAKTKGKDWRMKATLGSAAVGTVVGAVVAGPVGAAVGAGVSGVAGNAAGSLAARHHKRRVDEVVASATLSGSAAAAANRAD
jgi:uncharacterized protein YcfJ